MISDLFVCSYMSYFIPLSFARSRIAVTLERNEESSFSFLARESAEKHEAKRELNERGAFRRIVTKKYITPWSKSDSEFKTRGWTRTLTRVSVSNARPFPREIYLRYISTFIASDVK